MLAASNNRLTAHSYDANGNDLSFGTYDGFNRLATSNGAYYGYDPANKRVWKKRPDGVEEFTFYLGDQRLGTYTYNTSPVSFTALTTNLYFGGKPISRGGSATLTDRLGSDVTGGKRYFPWGQEYSATSNNTEKFATYYRDAESGLDYADQRYHGAGTGRFITPDPIGDGSNWYAYAGGDPVNSSDPRGTCDITYYGGDADVTVMSDGTDSPCASITVFATAGDGSLLTFTDDRSIRMLLGMGWQGDIPPGIFVAGCADGSQPQFCPPEVEQSYVPQPDDFLPDILGGLHTVLDIAGIVPGAGEVADLANAVIYLAEGNPADAAWSFAAMLPIGGQAVTASKNLRKAMIAIHGEDALKGMHAHHGLPQQFRELFERNGVNIDDPALGVIMDPTDHQQLHKALKYNDAWAEWLNDVGFSFTPEEAINKFNELRQEFKF